MKLRQWLRSFRYAYEGLVYGLSTQKNMKFHFMAAFAVLVLALLFDLTRLEILFLLLAITLIIVTELINTAVEKAVDLAMPDLHPLAKIAKDVAAASVLVTSFFAVAVGTIVFYEPMKQLIRTWRMMNFSSGVGDIWIILALVSLVVIVLHSRFSRRSRFKPSLIAASAFSIAMLIGLQGESEKSVLLAHLLAFIVLGLLYEKTDRTLPGLLLGGAVGSFVTFWVNYLL